MARAAASPRSAPGGRTGTGGGVGGGVGPGGNDGDGDGEAGGEGGALGDGDGLGGGLGNPTTMGMPVSTRAHPHSALVPGNASGRLAQFVTALLSQLVHTDASTVPFPLVSTQATRIEKAGVRSWLLLRMSPQRSASASHHRPPTRSGIPSPLALAVDRVGE